MKLKNAKSVLSAGVASAGVLAATSQPVLAAANVKEVIAQASTNSTVANLLYTLAGTIGATFLFAILSLFIFQLLGHHLSYFQSLISSIVLYLYQLLSRFRRGNTENFKKKV